MIMFNADKTQGKEMKGCGERFTWARCERHTCGEDLILPSGKRKKNYYLCAECSQNVQEVPK